MNINLRIKVLEKEIEQLGCINSTFNRDEVEAKAVDLKLKFRQIELRALISVRDEAERDRHSEQLKIRQNDSYREGVCRNRIVHLRRSLSNIGSYFDDGPKTTEFERMISGLVRDALKYDDDYIRFWK